MSMFKKAWLLLNYKQKKYAIFIFTLMFIAMIFEALSIGIILPLLSIFLKDDIDSSIFSYFFTFGSPTRKDLIYIGLLITLVIFLIKNLVLVFNLWQQTKFLQKLQVELTNKLFKYYLKNDYIFFLQNNSAHLYRNLTDIIGNYVTYTNKYMLILNEIIVSIAIAFVLFYVDFLTSTIILASLGVVCFLIYLSTVNSAKCAKCKGVKASEVSRTWYL